jgi:SAM-dependent methyltransferase
MSFWIAPFYDAFMNKAEDACLREWREELLGDLAGDILEVGAGTGANLSAYPTAGVQLTLCEPDAGMRKLLLEKSAQRRRADAVVTDWTAEHLGVESGSQDVVVSSLVCCSVADVDSVLAEIKRVLRPGGRLVFMEHVGAQPGSGRRRAQDALNPLWKRVAGNCHLNRDTEAALLRAGFDLQRITRESMRKALPLLRPTIRGVAVRR